VATATISAIVDIKNSIQYIPFDLCFTSM
jgi:hypothetical protein